MKIRLDQFVSKSKDISRNGAKDIIRKKLISVNDVIVKDSSIIINEDDIVKFKDEKLEYEEYIYLLLNKPVGYVTSTDDPNYKTVLSLIDKYKNRNLFPVGRLDYDTEGLLLITNDGELSHSLLSPNKHVSKTYIVNSLKEVSSDDILKVKNGIQLDNKQTNPITINKIDDKKYEVIISDGRYHEVKRIFEYINNQVLKLKRIKMGNLMLPKDLEVGKYIKLKKEEIENIK